ncbi:MAG: replication-associated recombination protein A [Flavobacteriales bacterium]|nr:replication-associated recombination protein A [Flavobacteriales bacterium]
MSVRKPLAERLRPATLTDFIAQEHLIGKDAILNKALESGNIPSMILWGPPGVGKTTLATIIANSLDRPFHSLSAINSGVKDVREVIDRAKRQATELNFEGTDPILFIDEIHRFSKSQQDSLLGAVEQGVITLIGATTENPSFEVISPLLSRCQVYILKSLEKDDLLKLLDKAIKSDTLLKNKKIELVETEALLRLSGGDARKLLNIFDLVVSALKDGESKITNDLVMEHVQQNIALYDKGGEQHYDIVSAFIKSMRGSDPNGAVYWLARMIEGGEDPKFIARRMLILASEDIGNANPTALVIANNCFQAIAVIGYPECELILSQTAIYLAGSPKSNASYKAITKAKSIVADKGALSVPLHLRNAPTKLMEELDYGKDYKYAHDFEGNFSDEEFLPDELSGTAIYEPTDNNRENDLRARLRALWGSKYGY